jgi:hypothetical protein
MIVNDPFGAFCRHTHVALAGNGHGPLQGQTMAVTSTLPIIAPEMATPCGSRRIRRRLAPHPPSIVCSQQAPTWLGRPIAMSWPNQSQGA